MSYRVANASSGAGEVFDLLDSDDLLVPLNVNIWSTLDGVDTIKANGSGQRVAVYGFVSSLNSAIAMDNGAPASPANFRVFIGNQGIVDAEQIAIVLKGGHNALTNYGQITSHSSAAVVFSAASTEATGIIRNYGSIDGQYDGINISGGGDAKIYNYGKIIGDTYAVAGDVGNDLVVNKGLLDGNVDLYFGDDTLLNRGQITGDVAGSDGSDLIDNRSGTIEGTITLGNENDTLLPGAGIETADGGSGSNTLDFSKSSGVHLALDGSIDATGWAKGDTYTNFANIIGSASGNDVLVGDAGDNTLTGLGGNDILTGGDGSDIIDGGRGNDTIDGGASVDTLSGGEGNDILLGGDGFDHLDGGAGNDTLNGGAGPNVLIGGTGADRFVFAGNDLAGSGSGPGSISTIHDFQHAERDKLDVSGIDANTTLKGDQAFTFIGGADFHHVAGELQYASGSVSGDTNGDGVADFVFDLLGLPALVKGDFIL